MSEYRVGTMNITGSDAAKLKEALYNPPCQEICKYKTYATELNNGITIQKHDDGFSAEIENFTLNW